MRQVRISHSCTVGLVLLLVGAASVPATAAGVSIRFGSTERNRLEGRRFDTMRGLAHYLDEAAQSAARQVKETSWPGRDRRIEASIDDFARLADTFHARVDTYDRTPWNVANEVVVLNQRARRVNWQIRNARGYRRIYDDWAEVMSTLDLMSRNVQGQDVEVPTQERAGYSRFDGRSRYADGRHQDLGPDVTDGRDPQFDGRDRTGPNDRGAQGDGRPGPFVTGQPLQEFRRLANDLDSQTSRILSSTPRNAGPDGQLNADMRDFARQAANLNRLTDAGPLDMREVGPMVQQLLDDARRTDASMRRNNTYSQVQPEWQASIQLLEQMASILQS
jgi:hypothetical protein